MVLLLFHFLLFLSPLANPTNTDLQRYEEDYQKIVNAYKNPSGISFTVSYCSYRDKNIQRADTSVSIRYSLKGSKFYYSSSSAEMLHDDSYYVAVDHKLRTMVVNKVGKVDNSFLPMQVVDSMVRNLNGTLTYSESSKEGTYTIDIKSPKSVYSKFQIIFDKNTYLITRISMYISDTYQKYLYGDGTDLQYKIYQPRVDYVYNNYKIGHIDEQVFLTSRFIKLNGRKVEAASAFGKFKLLDFSNIKK